MKVSAIIVNYNDFENTANLAKTLLNYKSIDSVVVIDNASTYSGSEVLSEIASEKYLFYKNHKNTGYGSGNNTGIKLARKVFGSSHAIIINPDVSITDAAISHMVDLWQKLDNDIMIMAPSTFVNGKRVSWHVNGFTDLVLSKEKILSKLLGIPFYPNSYFQNKEYCEVDAVVGACLMIEIDKFLEIGMYDSNMFLYEEENYLAVQCKKARYKTILVCNESYIHNHKSDNSKKLAQQLAAKRNMCNSLLYLLEHHCKYGRARMAAAKFTLWLCNIEVVAVYYLRKFRKGSR